MSLPFTEAQFFSTFSRYNEQLWPIPVLLTAGGAAAAIWALWKPGKPIWPLAFTAFLWVWAAGAYHVAFFASINPAAYGFAALFIVEAVLIAQTLRDAKNFLAPSGWQRAAGAVLFTYALVGYPFIGALAGFEFPASPTFGLPCPMTIFTFGVFCVFARSLRARVFLIPVLWSLVATTAALQMEVVQDLGLPVAAVLAVAVFVTARTPRVPSTLRSWRGLVGCL